MDTRSFIFDLVILNVWVNDFDYENNCLTVCVSFLDTEFTIEQNPENPGEFKQGRTCEFPADTEDLRDDLLKHPLKLTVTSNEENVLGIVDLPWPDELLKKLETGHLSCFNHFDQCDMRLNNSTTGKIGIQYRMRCKCDYSASDETDDETEERRGDIKAELKRIVNPNEVFFLIQNDSDFCNVGNEAKKKHKPCPTALDLSKFKNFHGKVVKDPGMFDQVYALDCCHTKKFSTDCKSQLCSESRQACPDHSRAAESKSSTQWACKAKKHVRECPHSNKFSDETGSCSCGCADEDVEPKTDIFNNGKMKNICHYPEPPCALNEDVYVRPRFCPVCKSDVSWLPKLAACTKCGHKPTPYVVERPYNENLTAEQILEEWADDKDKHYKNAESAPKRGNRCACKNGKVCAYCRIKRLCKDVSKMKKCHNAKSEESVSMRDTQDPCCNSAENDSRTYLARVFSELRDLYNLKPDMVKRGFETSKRCEKSFAASKPKPKWKNKHCKPECDSEPEPEPSKSKLLKTTSANIAKHKKEISQNMAGDAKVRWCKGKQFDYNAVRNYPGVLAGHKTCVSSGKYVPRNMGWLWTADTVGNRRGWRPGAIRKPIKEIMKFFLKDFPIESVRGSRYACKAPPRNEPEEIVQKPTLHICKKNGVYIITMRPLQDASMLAHCRGDLAKPLRFKIVKNTQLIYASKIKKQLKKTFNKCTCHNPISTCHCRTYLDKKRLEFELGKACREEGIPSLRDTIVLSDTSDSEMEFDFGVTPPAGVIRTHRKHRPLLASRETQYSKKDLIVKPMFPMKISKFMVPFDASGGRTKKGVEEYIQPERKRQCEFGNIHTGRSRRRAAGAGAGGGAGAGAGGKGKGGKNGLGMMIPPSICDVPKLRKAMDPTSNDPQTYMNVC